MCIDAADVDGAGPVVGDRAGLAVGGHRRRRRHAAAAGRRRTPTWLFVAVPEGKVVKNRIHFDFIPDDQQAEVERLIGLGARHVDIGQGEQSWVVLADPEGNEFCILAA